MTGEKPIRCPTDLTALPVSSLPHAWEIGDYYSKSKSFLTMMKTGQCALQEWFCLKVFLLLHRGNNDYMEAIFLASGFVNVLIRINNAGRKSLKNPT